MPAKVNETTYKKFLLLFIFIGLAASLINFFHNRSLWLDEAMLSWNIVNKSYSELLVPLNYNQVAPIGFLFFEKFISSLFGYTDWSLRLFPFFSFVFSIPLLYLFALKFTNDKKKALYSCAFFCLNLTILNYSFEVKQYSSDVLFGLLISLSSINYLNNNKIKTLILAIITGVIAVWFSNIAVVILFVFGSTIVLKSFKEQQFKGLIIVSCWITSFLLYYFLFMFQHPTQEYMLMYWTRKKAFVPNDLFSLDFLNFILSKSKMIFTDLLFKNYAGLIFLPFLFIGIWSFRNNKKKLLFLLLPMVVHLLLSFFRFYPFETRFILFQIPFITILLVEGIFFLFDFSKSTFTTVRFFNSLIPLLICFFLLSNSIPIEKEEMKINLNHINSHIQYGDNIYVYGSAASAYKFYMKSYPNIIYKGNTVYGGFHRDDWSQYDKEVIGLKGRSWLIFSQVYHLNGKNEEDYILNVLKKNGFKILSKKESTGTNCYEILK